MADPVQVGMDPMTGFALVGALGVGSQWLAWRLNLPGIVLMLAAGLLVGPVLGLLDPQAVFGDLLSPMISVAVAIILFEGGLTLNFHSLSEAAKGVRRLVVLGAPLGWVASTLALHYAAGLSWESSAVFGGIMIVTGPTVIAPLLRSARLQRRPAALLQWEAIVNDPIGALAAVLAFELVVVFADAHSIGAAATHMAIGIGVATVLGLAGGWGIVQSFRRALVPEYMKVPVLFVVVLAVFAASDKVLHESGLLAVTLMGLWIANANLPSFIELYRFKEHATVLLVSGVFILLSANMGFETLALLDWRAAVFVAAVILIARPLPVLLATIGSGLPIRERLFVALTGPRGVVLVAVAGLFGARLVEVGIEDAALIAPLAFVLVLSTVVLHGFTLGPVAKALGLTAAETPGVMIIGGSRFATSFAEALVKCEIPVLISDPNHSHLRRAREAGLPVYFGDVLSESAEHRLDMVAYQNVIAATDNDAYNTLVATDLAPEFGRAHVFQLKRAKEYSTRHALPATLGGKALAIDRTFREWREAMEQGYVIRVTGLTAEFTLDHWRETHAKAQPLAVRTPRGDLVFLSPDEAPRGEPGAQVIALHPPKAD